MKDDMNTFLVDFLAEEDDLNQVSNRISVFEFMDLVLELDYDYLDELAGVEAEEIGPEADSHALKDSLRGLVTQMFSGEAGEAGSGLCTHQLLQQRVAAMLTSFTNVKEVDLFTDVLSVRNQDRGNVT